MYLHVNSELSNIMNGLETSSFRIYGSFVELSIVDALAKLSNSTQHVWTEELSTKVLHDCNGI
jgi:hypothetical protein